MLEGFEGVAPLLELTDATVVKGGVRILDGLTLTIPAGEHTAILGPNGAGKTTLLNLLTHDDYAFADDHAPSLDAARDRPAVRVFGHDRWNVFDLRSQLGIISSDLHQRFVAGHSAGRIRGEDAVLSGFFATKGFLVNWSVTPEMRRRAAEALERLEVPHLAEKWMDEMSTGEARRVLIARALVTEPRALILDEPSAGLDIVARWRFLETMRRIARQGITIVLITHHVEEIIPEIERVILVHRGRVMDQGPKTSMLTSERLSTMFEAPVTVHENRGYFRTEG
jgi:iron complex transport system ATP-binding protein